MLFLMVSMRICPLAGLCALQTDVPKRGACLSHANVCYIIAHCYIFAIIQLAWANGAHFNNLYIWQELDVPHTANFVCICCQMWGLLKYSWNLLQNVSLCSLFHVTMKELFEFCCGQVSPSLVALPIYYSRKCEVIAVCVSTFTEIEAVALYYIICTST